MGLKPGGRASLPPRPLPSTALPSVPTSPPSATQLPSLSDIRCMEKLLIKGDVYTVATKTECTVTSANGTLLGKATAENPVTFTATTDRVELSDPGAEFARVNPKYAPVKLRLLGLLGGGSTNSLPAGYIAAEFVETQANSGMSYNSVIATSSTGFKTEYMHTVLNNSGAEPFYATDGKGNWLIPPRPNGTLAYWGSNTIRNLPVQVGEWLKVEMNYLNASKLTLNGDVRNLPDIGDITFGVLQLLRGQQKLKFLEITQENKKSNKLVPVIDGSGQVCLFDEVLNETLRSTNTQLIAGFTLAQARNLSKLPATGGTLTISLPSNWQEDEGVVIALATAEANGWVFTYQTYDDASASSTFALRRIFVRKTQNENGQYIDADGIRWHVEWCAGMIGAEPADHGYEPFRSVDAAVAYWELEPWVDPEAENLLTNQEQ